MFESPPRVSELKLEPLLSKGELVPDEWWKRPPPERVSFLRRHWLFLATFVLPVAAAVVYFALIASSQYVSEARFLVRMSSQDDGVNLASLMQNQKLSRASDETYAINEYLVSRDAMQALVANGHLRDILARPSADIFNRYPNFYTRRTDEGLYRHFLRFVSVEADSESGISTLTVRAFTAQDAQDLARAMMKNAEDLVNRLNARYYDDALRLADKFVEEEKSQVLDVEKRLTDYRNTERVVDPNKESAAALIGIGAMMTTLMQTEAGLSQQIAMAPTSPQIGPLRDRIASLRDQIVKERAKIVGGDASMARKLAEFDQLMLDRELAARGLELAVTHLVSARENAERQQYYLQTVVEPGLADQALYPRRFLYTLFVAAISFFVFWIARTILRNIAEHQA